MTGVKGGSKLALVGGRPGGSRSPGTTNDPTPLAGDTFATSPAPELTKGTVLASRYRLVRPIAAGGMGRVWEALHETLDAPAAIKLIDPRLASDPVARQRFLREAKAAAALRSRHVVQILDYGVHEDTPYIAMELLRGESLAARLRRVGLLSPDAASGVLDGVFAAVEKAHELGLVHRDLKPANIFLCEPDDGDRIEAKVLDFGLAKGLMANGLDLTTQVGATIGTPHYMSPEQLIDAATCDTRADLWSLAVIAYECLLGQRPFIGSSTAELAVAVLAQPPPVPSDHGGVPAGFDAWFERATRRDPTQRFQTAAHLHAALRDVLVGRDTPPLPVEPQRRLWLGLLAGGLAAAVGVATWGTLLGDDAAAPQRTASPPSPSAQPATAPRARGANEAETPAVAPLPTSPVSTAPRRPSPAAPDAIEEEPTPGPAPPDAAAGHQAAKTVKRRPKRAPTKKPAADATPRKGFDVRELEAP